MSLPSAFHAVSCNFVPNGGDCRKIKIPGHGYVVGEIWQKENPFPFIRNVRASTREVIRNYEEP